MRRRVGGNEAISGAVMVGTPRIVELPVPQSRRLPTTFRKERVCMR
jgi:hypothetical protein